MPPPGAPGSEYVTAYILTSNLTTTSPTQLLTFNHQLTLLLQPLCARNPPPQTRPHQDPPHASPHPRRLQQRPHRRHHQRRPRLGARILPQLLHPRIRDQERHPQGCPAHQRRGRCLRTSRRCRAHRRWERRHPIEDDKPRGQTRQQLGRTS